MPAVLSSNSDFSGAHPLLASLKGLTKEGVVRHHLVIERGGLRFGLICHVTSRGKGDATSSAPIATVASSRHPRRYCHPAPVTSPRTGVEEVPISRVQLRVRHDYSSGNTRGAPGRTRRSPSRATRKTAAGLRRSGIWSTSRCHVHRMRSSPSVPQSQRSSQRDSEGTSAYDDRRVLYKEERAMRRDGTFVASGEACIKAPTPILSGGNDVTLGHPGPSWLFPPQGGPLSPAGRCTTPPSRRGAPRLARGGCRAGLPSTRWRRAQAPWSGCRASSP